MHLLLLLSNDSFKKKTEDLVRESDKMKKGHTDFKKEEKKRDFLSFWFFFFFDTFLCP